MVLGSPTLFLEGEGDGDDDGENDGDGEDDGDGEIAYYY